MKYDPKHHVMMSVNDFAELCGYHSADIGLYKAHGAFIGEFQKDGWIPRELVEFYLQSRGVGVPFSVATQKLYIPKTCCRSGSSLICRTDSKQGKLLEIISSLEELVHPVPDALIWTKVFLQTDSCFLKNDYEYMYFLFHLIDTGRLVRVKDAEGDDLYSVSLVPKKRGVGRPRKYI